MSAAPELDQAITEIRSSLRLHTWILSFNTAFLVAIVGKLFLSH
jgi:hypothetical protein